MYQVSGQEASGTEIQPALHLPSLVPWPSPLPGCLYLNSPKAPRRLELPWIPTPSADKEPGVGAAYGVARRLRKIEPWLSLNPHPVLVASTLGPGQAQPVLLLHAADSEAQRRLVGALAELLRATLGGGRDVIVDLWEGTRMARVGPLPWLWAARAQVTRERGTVLLLWSSACSSPICSLDPRTAPLCGLLSAAPRPLLLLAYFSSLCTKGDIPPPLRDLPRYRLLRDLPRLLRALGAAGPSTQASGWGRLGARQCLRSRLELCRRLELEAATLTHQT